MSKPTNLEALFAAARACPPETDRLEYAFETRLMARLAEERAGSLLTWAWKLSPYFAAVALAVACWSHAASASAQSDSPLWASADNVGEEQALVYFMTGQETAEE